MRLGDLDALTQKIEDKIKTYDDENAIGRVSFEYCKMLIDNAPTVYTNGEYEALCKITDAEFEVTNGFWVQTPKGKKIYFEKKRPKGEWIKVVNKISENEAETHWECSECHNPDFRLGEAEFCSFCGADMRGDKGESRMKTPEEITIWCDMMLNRHPNIEDTNFFNSIKDYMKDQRPQGEWIDTGSGQECNICHEIQYGYDNFRFYCAHCGAKMQKAGAENDL